MSYAKHSYYGCDKLTCVSGFPLVSDELFTASNSQVFRGRHRNRRADRGDRGKGSRRIFAQNRRRTYALVGKFGARACLASRDDAGLTSLEEVFFRKRNKRPQSKIGAAAGDMVFLIAAPERLFYALGQLRLELAG